MRLFIVPVMFITLNLSVLLCCARENFDKCKTPQLPASRNKIAANKCSGEISYVCYDTLANNLPILLGNSYSFVLKTLGKPFLKREIGERSEIDLEYKLLPDQQAKDRFRRQNDEVIRIRIIKNSVVSIQLDYRVANQDESNKPSIIVPIPITQAIGEANSLAFFSTHNNDKSKPKNQSRDFTWKRISLNLSKLRYANEHEIEKLLGPAEYIFSGVAKDNSYCFQMAYYPYLERSDDSATAESLVIKFSHNRPQTIEISKYANCHIY